MKVDKFISNTLFNIGLTRNYWPRFIREYMMMRMYRRRTDRKTTFDLNNPQLFTEKIQWYMSRYKKKNLVNLVDKYLCKEYIKEKLGEGYTAKLLGVWHNTNDFIKAWDTLPDKFVLKSTIMSNDEGVKIICKSSVNIKLLTKEIANWLKKKNTLINSYRYAYFGTLPRIIAEEFIDTGEERLSDYKFFCFNGIPHCAYVDKNHQIAFYDLKWNKLNVLYNNFPNGIEVARPKHFEQMIETARTLSKDFPFLRVDFYDTPDKLYVGELTLYPGDIATKFQQKSFDEHLGRLFILPQ